jgi:hypothetical protein
MPEPDRIETIDVEAIVRKYLARIARRYTPLFGALVVLLLMATLVPSRSPVIGGASSNDGSNAVGDLTGTGDAALGGGLSTPGPGGSSAPGTSGTSVSGAGGSGGGAGTGGPITAPAKAGSKGVARSGVSCGPGVKQVRFTVYSAACTPKYSGNNGGNTYRGVTKDKIIAFYRHARSAQDAAVNAALGDANLDDDNYIADLNTYIGYFNKQFELYGRQLQLVVFDGQGDYLSEDQGLDQGQAQADAQRAVDLNGFVDLTFPLKGSYPFWQALAERKAMSMGPTGFPNGWYTERSPYWYSVLPTGTGIAGWLTNLTCRRLVNMNAVFAGDTLYKNKKRVFGLVHPDNPEYKEIGALVNKQLSKCGAKPAREISYTINVASMGNQSTSVVAQLKAAQVSTALCYCDPIFPIFLTNSADGQEYSPEWWSPGWGESQGQTLNQNQWQHAFVTGARYPKKNDDEAYRVFKLIKPNAEPANAYYAVAYAVTLMLFDALQTAGPRLDPFTFQKGWFGIGTIKGPAGTLEWKPGHYSPVVEAPAAWWSTDTPSDFNGEDGSYLPCNGGKFLPFDLSRAAEWGTGQLGCFKK